MSEGLNEPGPDDLVAQSRFLRALARRLIRDEHGAEDLVQDTLVVALENGVPAGRRQMAWLAGILKNLVRMSIRSDARRRRREELAAPRLPADPADVAARLEAQDRLLQAVRDLPEPYRATLVARFFDEMSAEEIARSEGVPASTVRTRTRRGLAMLRERLDGESGNRRAWVIALLPIARLPVPTIAAAAMSSTITTGAILMSAKKMLALGVVVLLLATGGTVTYLASTDDEPATTRADRSAAIVERDEREAPPPTKALLPEPVDLAAADRDLDLHGQLTDRGGAPVAGATLEALSYPWRRSSVLNVPGHDEIVVVRATKSARDGTFSLRLSRGRLVDLRIRAEGLAETTIASCQAGERVDAVLTAGAEILFRCTDDAGRPIENVEINMRRSLAKSRSTLERRGSTNERGQVLITALTPGRVTVFAEHAVHGFRGLPSRDLPAIDVPTEGRITIDIAFPAGRTVFGFVKDAITLAPIPGASVGVGWPLRRATRSDAHGRFAIPGWVDGDWTDIHVIAEGYGRQGRTVPREGEVEFALFPGDVVTGRIVDHEGVPVTDALVSAVASNGSGPGHEIDTRSCQSGPDGRFRLTSLRRDIGDHRLVVLSPGHAKLLFPFSPTEDGPGTIDLGDLTLPTARAIEGRILDGDGRPVAGVRIMIATPDAWKGFAPRYGDREERHTDDLGRFRFPDFPPGEYEIHAFEIRASSSDARSGKWKVDLSADRDLTDLECRIEARTARRSTDRRLRVRVIDETGAPVAGILIANRATRRPVRTNADGRCVIDGLPLGKTWVSVLLLPSHEYIGGTNVQVGADQEEVTIPLQRAAMLRGVVLGPDGRPLPGIIVRAWREGALVESRIAPTDEMGAFDIATSPGMTVDLDTDGRPARRGDRLPIRGELRHVTGPRDGLVLRTTPVTLDRKLTLRVLDLEDRPVEGALLLIWARGETWEARTGPDGRGTLANLPSDKVIVRIHPGTAIDLAEIAVDPTQVRLLPDGQEVVARFRPGVPIVGVVLNPDGDPVAGAEVKVMDDKGFERCGVTDEDGRFRCMAIPGKSHRVWARFKVGGEVFAGILGDVRPDGKEVVVRPTSCRSRPEK
jgi:RNA polymerase sigma factor (sigma-70 family)